MVAILEDLSLSAELPHGQIRNITSPDQIITAAMSQQQHTLLSAGSNSRGQLGIGSTNDSHLFQKCSFVDCPPFQLPAQTTRIVDLVTGANHTVILLELSDQAATLRREIWGTGDGSKGQLGGFKSQDTTENPALQTLIFRKIELPLLDASLGDYSFKFIGAAWETSYIVLSCEGKDDMVISMGSNEYGDLGIGGSQLEHPFNIVHLEHLFRDTSKRDRLIVNSLTVGQRHVILDLQVLFSDKSSYEQVIVGWGTSRQGQLGAPSSSTQRPPPFVPAPKIIPLPRQLDPVVTVALGFQHSVFLHASGHVTSLGSDKKGQLQIVSNIDDIKDIKCTWNGTYRVVRDGSGWSIISSGSNSHGQLGYQGPSVSTRRVIFPSTVNAADTFVQIACGTEHVIALISPLNSQNPAGPTSQVWGWGWNEHGNLGLGATEDVKVPVHIWPLGLKESVHVSGIWAGCGTSWIDCVYR